MNNPKKTIIITGANGYLGKIFCYYFLDKGYQVRAFVRKTPKSKIKNIDYVLYNLNSPLNTNDFTNVSTVIHGAYSKYTRGKDSNKENIDGMKRLIKMCNKQSIPILYLSSFSSHKKALSNYGKHKFYCESLLNPSKDSILKISFILGPEGILKEITSKIKSSPFFPVIGGRKPLQIITIEDICLSLYTIIEKKLTGTFHLGHNEVISMKKFYQKVASIHKSKITFLPVPISIVYIACRFFESIKVAPPISSESVLGLQKMRSFDTLETQNKLGISFKNIDKGLKDLKN